jgi:hypothetical protein
LLEIRTAKFFDRVREAVAAAALRYSPINQAKNWGDVTSEMAACCAMK